METKNKKFNIIGFRITASRLLKMPIESVEDVKKFYMGVNNLAFQIASNAAIINRLSSLRYDDNQKLFKGIIHILTYGQAIGKSELFAQKSTTGLLTVKKINLNTFFEKNPWVERKIKNVQKETNAYFYTLINGIPHYTKEEVDKTVDELKKEIKEIKDSKMIFPEEKEILIGPLKYKDFRIFYNEKPLKLTPQLTKLCRLFMMKSHKADTFVSNDTISACISKKGLISHKNMEKTVSKLRRILRKENKHISIERTYEEGYTFIAKKIR